MDALRRTPFSSPTLTEAGAARALVAPTRLRTLWFNTGTLCNLSCANCYIESTPSNRALVYLRAAVVTRFLEEIRDLKLGTEEIGFTGGEPCMNPDLPHMLNDALQAGHRVLLLTNAMRPMMKISRALRELRKAHGSALEVRVSVDHFEAEKHSEERGPKSWQPTLDGLQWLSDQGFNVSVAGRTRWGESEADLRVGFGQLFEHHNIRINAQDAHQLVLFPEMDQHAPVAEISTDCWKILQRSPAQQMCAESRMVVQRQGESEPTVLACTLIAYERGFELGRSLAEALRPVLLNHPHCARFCVLGGSSCSARD